MTGDPYFGFIAGAYGIGFLVVAGMIAAVMLDYRNLRRALAKFDGASRPVADD